MTSDTKSLILFTRVKKMNDKQIKAFLETLSGIEKSLIAIWITFILWVIVWVLTK